MINPQLLNYVRVQRQAGVPKEEIIKALAGGGWSAQDAQEAFAAIEGVQVPPQPPKPVPPPVTPSQSPAPQPVMRPVQPVAPMQPPVQPVQQPVMQAMPVQPMAQTSVRIQPQAVVQRQPAYAQIKKRRVWPWMLLLVIFLLGGFVGGAYAALQYPIVEDMVRSIQNMISPSTLESVYDPVADPDPMYEQQNNLPSFMPQIDPLGTNTSTTTASTTVSGTASTTPR